MFKVEKGVEKRRSLPPYRDRLAAQGFVQPETVCYYIIFGAVFV